MRLERLGVPRGLVAVTAVMVLLALNCNAVFDDIDDARANLDGTTVRSPGSSKAARIKDSFLGFRSTKKADGTAFAFIRAPRELWTPFRWETRAGLINPSGTDVGPGFFCTELDGKGTDPLEYYGICAQPLSGGLNVWVIRRGNSNVAQQFFPGISVVEFAVEADGETMTFQARAPGAGSWDTIATLPFSSQSFALEPSIGAAQMPASREADFDFLRVVSNGTRPGATAMELAAHTAWRIVDGALEAAYALDGGVDDTVAAMDAIYDAEARLAETTAAVDGIGDAGLSRAVGRRLRAAGKALSKARARLVKGVPSKAVLRLLKKAGQNAGTAALTLGP